MHFSRKYICPTLFSNFATIEAVEGGCQVRIDEFIFVFQQALNSWIELRPKVYFTVSVDQSCHKIIKRHIQKPDDLT